MPIACLATAPTALTSWIMGPQPSAVTKWQVQRLCAGQLWTPSVIKRRDAVQQVTTARMMCGRWPAQCAAMPAPPLTSSHKQCAAAAAESAQVGSRLVV